VENDLGRRSGARTPDQRIKRILVRYNTLIALMKNH